MSFLRNIAANNQEQDGVPRTAVSLASIKAIHGNLAALNASVTDASPEDITRAALATVGRGRYAIVSSFGTESAVMLAATAAVDPGIPVLLLNTGYLFPETIEYRDLLVARLGLTDVRDILPDATETAAEDPEGALFVENPDACCALRKVRPLARVLNGFDAWGNGRKRYQGGERASIPVVEADGARLKFNPLANLSREEVMQRFAALDLPQHPLERLGFTSIGCMPCTSRVKPGEDPRAGRWRGRGKVECGLHTGPLSAAPKQ